MTPPFSAFMCPLPSKHHMKAVIDGSFEVEAYGQSIHVKSCCYYLFQAVISRKVASNTNRALQP